MFLEVLDRRGRVTGRSRFCSSPITVGRALHNDVVVEDRYVCPEHLRITPVADGEVLVEDLGSVNGLYGAGATARAPRLSARSGTTFRIGHTTLRVRSSDAAVEPTVLDRSGRFTPGDAFSRWPAALLISGACFVCFGFASYLGQYGKEPLQHVLFMTLVLLTLVVLWATGWALVNRVVGQQWRFSGHCAVVSVFGLASMLCETLFQYGEFFFPDRWWVGVADAGTQTVLVTWLLSGHLALLATVASRKRVVSAAVTAVCLVSLFEGLAYYQQTQFSPMIDIEGVLKPVPAAWIPARPIGDFLADSSKLQPRLDELAKDEEGPAARSSRPGRRSPVPARLELQGDPRQGQ